MTLQATRDGEIFRLTLERPEKANALDSRLLEDLARALESLFEDSTLRVVVLGGAGRTIGGGEHRAFCFVLSYQLVV